MSFYDRYAECCREKGILPSSQATAEKLGCSRSNISNFASSGITPRGDIVANAAKMLDVSADYLLGIEKKNGRTVDVSGLTDEEVKAVEQIIVLLRKKK